MKTRVKLKCVNIELYQNYLLISEFYNTKSYTYLPGCKAKLLTHVFVVTLTVWLESAFSFFRFILRRPGQTCGKLENKRKLLSITVLVPFPALSLSLSLPSLPSFVFSFIKKLAKKGFSLPCSTKLCVLLKQIRSSSFTPCVHTDYTTSGTPTLMVDKVTCAPEAGS